MTESQQQVQSPQTDNKEYNFRLLELKYQRQLEAEQQARLEAERLYQATMDKRQTVEEDDDEPFVNHKRLDQKLSAFEKNFESKVDKIAEEKARVMIEKNKHETWLKMNPDFVDVMNNAHKLYDADPELGETILSMPDTFERQKLVYKNIKALRLDRPVAREPSIQEKIDANRQSPYYQPSSVGNAPYRTSGDFSTSGQKAAFDKMQELKARISM